ncbi:MAG: hypothetical protein JSR99_03420 [Proteobacteria bacterium]|nr:hypothetical protein [Pseudomonadota bacterium]
MVPQSGMAWPPPQGMEVLVLIIGEPAHALAEAMPASGASAETTATNRTSNVRHRCINNPKVDTRLRLAVGWLGSS